MTNSKVHALVRGIGAVVALVILSLWHSFAGGALITDGAGRAVDPVDAASPDPVPLVLRDAFLPEAILAAGSPSSPYLLWGTRVGATRVGATRASPAPLRLPPPPATVELQAAAPGTPLFPASFWDDVDAPKERFDAVAADDGLRLTWTDWALAALAVAGGVIYLLQWYRRRRFTRAARRRRHIAIKGRRKGRGSTSVAPITKRKHRHRRSSRSLGTLATSDAAQGSRASSSPGPDQSSTSRSSSRNKGERHRHRSRRR